jgi:hypothetical protein
MIVAGKHRLHFTRQAQRGRRRPLRRQPRVNQQQVVLDEDERSCSNPGDKLVAVRRGKDLRNGVIDMLVSVTGGDRKQMQVVITEHRHGGIADRFYFAQHRQRIGAAIDEVADQPQSVHGWRKTDQFQQLAELGVAALDVADRVEAHRPGITPTLMVEAYFIIGDHRDAPHSEVKPRNLLFRDAPHTEVKPRNLLFRDAPHTEVKPRNLLFAKSRSLSAVRDERAGSLTSPRRRG